jgi:hypothetical protein
VIKLKDILSEIESKDSYKLHKSIVLPKIEIQKYFDTRKEDIKNLIDLNEYDQIYAIFYNKFSNIPQALIAQFVNNEILSTNWTMLEPKDSGGGFIEYSDAEPKDNNLDATSSVWKINLVVDKWVKKHRDKLIRLADADDYRKFYQSIVDAYPKAPQDKLMQAFQSSVITHGIHYEISTDV